MHSKRSSSSVNAFYNFGGRPAINLPLERDQMGLPSGMHKVRRFGAEDTLLRLAASSKNPACDRDAVRYAANPAVRAGPSWLSSFRQARSQTPCSSHIRNRRQQVDPSGYSSGRSRHRAPVRSIHRIPSEHARLLAHVRPRPSLRRFGSGNNGANNAHCFSLKNTARFFIRQAHHSTRLNNESLS